MCAAAVMFMVAAPVSATSGVTVVDAKVMSQNLYIGADLDRILRGEDPAAVFQTVLESNVLERFATFAAQVDAENPDLIGLQEVTKIVVFDAQGNILQDIDYLDIVLGNLAARGESFAVSSVVANADVTLPLDLQAGLFARVIDRDVIIHNTATTAVSNPESANYATNFAFNLGGIDIEFTRGYTAVDAVVSGSSFRFVNTHLEVQNAPCLPPTGLAICQEVQAAELVEALAGESLPVVLLGDFNAEPGEPTYETIVDGGYADTWNNEGGDTCCQSELLNEPSDLTQRIDIIFHGAANAAHLGHDQHGHGSDARWPVVLRSRRGRCRPSPAGHRHLRRADPDHRRHSRWRPYLRHQRQRHHLHLRRRRHDLRQVRE